MIALVSLSRVYFGVHFISDVVAAWGIAAVLCWLFGGFHQSHIENTNHGIHGNEYKKREGKSQVKGRMVNGKQNAEIGADSLRCSSWYQVKFRVIRVFRGFASFFQIKSDFLLWFRGLGFRWKLLWAFWAALALLAIGMGIQIALEPIPDSPAWSAYSAQARDWNGLFRSGGEFLGAAWGIVLAGRWARFEVAGPLWQRGTALVYALLGAWLLRELGKLVPALSYEILQSLNAFFQGALQNLWFLFLAPWILLKIKLLHKISNIDEQS